MKKGKGGKGTTNFPNWNMCNHTKDNKPREKLFFKLTNI